MNSSINVLFTWVGLLALDGKNKEDFTFYREKERKKPRTKLHTKATNVEDT